MQNTYVFETITAHGHPNVKATHRTTLEVTREDELTPRGDCIIGVGADKAAADLSPEFKEIAARDTAIIIVVLEAGGYRDIVLASGSRRLIMTDNTRIIIRRSSYVEPATIAVWANKAAGNIDRRLAGVLRKPSTILHVTLLAFDLNQIYPANKGSRSIV
jgi:hypothetical protein